MSGRDIETCWWCRERPATTREHRIKQTRLKDEERLSATKGNLTLYSADPAHPRPTELNGTNAKAAKFGKTLCAPCNSTHSQRFDEAYTFFTQWAFDNKDYVRSHDVIEWDLVFAGEEFDQRDLVRYYLKNVCCRIIDQGYEKVPDELCAYLDDLQAGPCFNIQLYKDFDLVDVAAQHGTDNWFSPYTREANSRHPDDPSQLAIFHTVIQDGFIGILLSWYAPEYRKRVNSFNIAQDSSSVIYERKSITWAQPMFDKIDALEAFIWQELNTFN